MEEGTYKARFARGGGENLVRKEERGQSIHGLAPGTLVREGNNGRLGQGGNCRSFKPGTVSLTKRFEKLQKKRKKS